MSRGTHQKVGHLNLQSTNYEPLLSFCFQTLELWGKLNPSS